MKIIILFICSLAAFSMKSCELCIKLSQYNFDYAPLLDQNYCQDDYNCQQAVREISYRYMSGTSGTNPCTRDPYNFDCSSFGIKVCSQMLDSSCGGFSFRGSSQSSVEPGNISQIMTLKEQLNRLENEANEVEKQMQGEISRQKQKYMNILERLNELQSGI
ncbi:unnamed protein product [Blepharisma stoltei]|uniref:Uncharacterized protein n=1 Tax=Blepharisma stoltei TaxID=1481888 RepID=A0AAU9JGF8_9CILI|nr:unnamed protein product [Blepharisma stoltei]